MKRNNIYLFLAVLFISFGACSQKVVPKPDGYPRLEPGWTDYSLMEVYPEFTFLTPSLTNIEPVEMDTLPGLWFNICYPEQQARIYCSYFTEEKKNFRLIEDDIKRFISFHIQRADAWNVSEFRNPENQVFGLIYRLEGDVPSPTQFIITDSVASFVRGVLYFDTPMNRDSLAPVIDCIDRDVEILMESFRWKNT